MMRARCCVTYSCVHRSPLLLPMAACCRFQRPPLNTLNTFLG